MKTITSVQNPFIKSLVQLQEKAKVRKQTGMFLMEGKREIELALKGNYELETVLFVPELIENENNGFLFEVNNEVYEDIKLTFSHAGRTKTVRLNDVDRLSMIEDVPDYIYNGNNINREKLVKHMEKTAQDYASRMIFVHK